MTTSRRFFDEEFTDAVPLMPALLEDFKNNPTGLTFDDSLRALVLP